MRDAPIFHYLTLFIMLASCRSSELKQERLDLADKIDNSIRTELLNKWYPQALDTVYGGFLSSFTFDFKPTGEQNKMIVSQSRHVWTTARASMAYPGVEYFLPA